MRLEGWTGRLRRCAGRGGGLRHPFSRHGGRRSARSPRGRRRAQDEPGSSRCSPPTDAPAPGRPGSAQDIAQSFVPTVGGTRCRSASRRASERARRRPRPRPRSAPPPAIRRGVHHDPPDPCLERPCPGEAAALADRTCKCLLHDVLGCVRIADDPRGHASEPRRALGTHGLDLVERRASLGACSIGPGSRLASLQRQRVRGRQGSVSRGRGR